MSAINPNPQTPYPQVGFVSGNCPYPTASTNEAFPMPGIPMNPIPSNEASNVMPTPSAPAHPSPPPDWKGEVLSFDPQILPYTHTHPHPNFDNPPSNLASKAYDTKDIGMDEVRKALERFAAGKRCSGNPNDIVIREIDMQNVFKYHLLTTTEMRKTRWVHEPYQGQTVPGPEHVPNAWDIPASQKRPFTEEKRAISVPGTYSVRPCQFCWGAGNSRCKHCSGRGYDICTWCKGQGFQVRGNRREPCTSCGAMGRNHCTSCHGSGSSKCKECKGKGQIFTFLQLNISWKVHSHEVVSEKGTTRGLPKEELADCDGVIVFQDSHSRLFPLLDFPNDAVQKGSRVLLENASKLQTNEVVIREQKHMVEVVRIAAVKYSCKGKNGTFYVFGENSSVYFPDYPSQGCCTVA